MIDKQEALLRSRQLFGDEAIEKLARCRVAVFGLGGVGGHALEALVRSGVGAVDLIDGDVVSVSNLNRQLIATEKTVGTLKTAAFKERIAEIFPDVRVSEWPIFFLPGEERSERIDFSGFDYVVDAIDTVTAKVEIIRRAKAAGVPVISCMGTGRKLDPMGFTVADISKTDTDPLAKAVRLALRKQGITGVKVVFSRELPLPDRCPEEAERRESGRPSPGSNAFVPAAAGLLIAATVVGDLIAN